MTTPTSLASTTDVEDLLLRPLTTSEQPIYLRLLAKATAALRQRMPSVDARLAADPTSPQWLDASVVADVVAGAVKRFASNPEGLASTSTATGPFNNTKTYAIRGDSGSSKVADTRGQIVITDADLARLAIHQPAGQPGSITMSPALAPWPLGRLGFGDCTFFDANSPVTGDCPVVVELPVPIYGPDR